MKKLIGGILALTVACLLLGLWWFGGSRSLKLDTSYQALLLDNGQVYYGKVDRMNSEVAVLTDVYCIQNQIDAQTKAVKKVLIRRGNEWHAPTRSVINTRHIIMTEPVTPGSKVAGLIAELKSKDH